MESFSPEPNADPPTPPPPPPQAALKTVMEQKISNQVVDMLLRQLRKKPGDINPTMRIKEDLGADSLDVVEILMNIEDKYGISISDEALNEIKTVGDLINFVDKMAAEK
jgi:acyl carrier protein